MPSDGPVKQTLQRPRIRILHQLARSGGTVISRCLASMENVVLLSEIHPLGTRKFDPLQQAKDWYGLVTASEVASSKRGRAGFVEAIALISQRCAELGKMLVLRDWNHLDYIGMPYVQPDFRPLLAESLQGGFELIRVATVRHPLDQWLSLTRDPAFGNGLAMGKYLKGVRRFAEMAVQRGFHRFEDFTADSDAMLQQLCASLQLPFDPAYRQRWTSYTNITGDVLPGRSAEGQIQPLPRQHGDTEALRDFTSRGDYRRIQQLLDYTG
jgi:protein O-GlcNAc transferase